MQIEDRETARLAIHVDQRHQHQHRADEGIEEEFQRRIDAIGPAPDTDDQEHRDQHRLEEDVEQYRIQRGEGADHETFHEQEGREVLRGAILDHFPGRDDDQHGGETGQQDQRHRDPVDPQVIVDIELADPRHLFDELHAVGGAVEQAVQRQGQDKGQDREHQGDLARPGRLLVTGKQHQRGTDDGQPDDQAQ